MRYSTREAWLTKAYNLLTRELFNAGGYYVPQQARVTCGWPSVGGLRRRKQRIGEAWSSKASRDDKHEIFVSPVLDDTTTVLATLLHEMVHVAVGLQCGHKGPFKICATDLGLQGPMTSTSASQELAQFLKHKVEDKIGRYPHGSITAMTNFHRKQPTYFIKVCCDRCGYTARITRKWLDVAVPQCPNPECASCGATMQLELSKANPQ